MASHFQIFSAAARLGWASYVRNKKATEALVAQIRAIESLDDATAKRIFFYTIQSAVTTLWFTTLRGYDANESEKKNALYMGAITPLVDDATDEKGMLSEEILFHLRQKDDEVFKAASGFYQHIRATAQPCFDDIAAKTLQAQDASIKQALKEKLNTEEIAEITFQKGGYATLLYRIMLQNELVPNEERAIMLLGSLLQMTNDAFDVYKDYHNGFQTLFTTTTDVVYLREMFMERIAQMKDLFMQTGYAIPNVKRLLHQALLVVTRGLVCIDHLVVCQKSKGIFDPSLHERKELIVDMEKADNIWKTWQYARKLS